MPLRKSPASLYHYVLRCKANEKRHKLNGQCLLICGRLGPMLKLAENYALEVTKYAQKHFSQMQRSDIPRQICEVCTQLN